MVLGGGKRVLLVGGEGVVLYAPSGRGVDRETSIAWEVPNFDQQLTEALSEQNQSKSVLVLFDGADQTYRKEENIPKLSPIDRPRFVRRKLELAFPSYPIRASLEIKPPKIKGQRQVRRETPAYLFVALPETEQLDRIGGALYESGVPVSGFGLLPMESSSLVTELATKVFSGKGKSSRWSVLIGQHETGGLRQVVVKDGGLALTRLTPTSEAGATGAGWVEEVVREFKATLTYISRFGYSADDGLDVIVICGDVERQFFDQKALPVTNFSCLNVSDALRRIGAKSFGLEKSNFADALHAAWAGRKASLKLPIRVPSIHRVQAPRLAARMGSVLFALTALGLAFLVLQDYRALSILREETMQKQNQKMMLEREYEQESKVFDKLPVRPEIVKSTLAVKNLLETNTVNLSPLFHRLKAALGGDIKVEELKVEHTPGTGLNLSGSQQTGAFGAVVTPDPADKGKIKVSFKFGLPASMPLEQKVTRAEQMLASLKLAFPDHNARIVTQFGRVDRKGQMTGGVGSASQGTAGANDLAEFELEGAPL